ncbi:MAG: MotA/TolQ/ExbB proton channel family protein [Saprospiraceae bacterium]|nr:MotA/TolQ/ExbB proton channel family protein [Saprospiraceae bacterium]MCC7507315.1 MotA/TolQ/ExbB proton channel family protein [Saprospiraceae bacterium]
MTAAKPTANNQQKKSGSSALMTFLIIIGLYALAFCIWKFVFGSPANFVDNDPSKDPLPGNYPGTVYKGGPIVPILMTTFFTVIVFVFERFITLNKASGASAADAFVRGIKGFLDRNDISGALAACDKQKGAVANVVRAGLTKYAEMEKATDMDKDQKVLAIQKEVEEATTLELPMLERNLSILATVASIATLLGLLGTVLGMIRSFAALANAGAPDSTALATGISEALINTALGIFTSALAIIAYNFFTGRIDAMTYRIDEAGYSLTQTFASKHH